MMMKVSGLEVFYGASQALFGIDFEINEGECVTLLGRNGMGKTTTVNSIMGIAKPASGSITFDEQEIAGKPSHMIANLGFGLVPEGRQIFPNLSTRENLIATASNHLRLPNPWSEERVYELFPELASRRSSIGNLLSGGEQQMLAVGRALMTNPRLLILDEATEGLAPLIRQKIWSALDQIRAQGISILLIDKNINDLLRLADRHFIIEKGRVVWSGASNDLKSQQDIQHRYIGI